MVAGLRKGAGAVVAGAFFGASLGVLLSALVGKYLPWTPLMTAIGAGIGIAFGYGFFPLK